GRQRISGQGVVHAGAVEDVDEISANVQRDPLLEAERAAEPKILNRPALIAVIAIVSRRRAELAGGRLAPCGRIQNEILVGIEAVTVKVPREQRYARITVREC